MTREVIGFTLVMLVFVVAYLVYSSVRRLRSNQESLLPSILPPASDGTFETFYVATVFADRPLDRVWAYGLGIRGKAKIGLSSQGVSVHRVGERGFLIPAPLITGLISTQATIDKGVERDGLTTILWTQGEIELQSVFRFTNPKVRANFSSQLQTMIGAKLG
jgi:hypothetical protein